MICPGRRLTHERVGRFLAGLSSLAAVILAWLWSPWWLLAAGGVGLNLIVSGLTDRCFVKSLLIRMGLPGERDVGRAEAIAERPVALPVAFRRAIRRPVVPVN